MASDTRTCLIDAAERVFAERGFEAATVRVITSEAQANIAAAHYHFGSKEALLRAVLDRYIVPLNRRRLELLAQASAESDGAPLPVETILR